MPLLCRFYFEMSETTEKIDTDTTEKKLKCFETTFLHEITVKKRKKRVQKVEKQ
jgi:hypothetical protein